MTHLPAATKDATIRAQCKGELRLEGKWSFLGNAESRQRWLDGLESCDWNVFIEGPPHGKSRPEHVAKYLARYISGGPIANRRLVSDQDGRITFMARSRDESRGNPPEPYSLKGFEFVRRYALHILPKGFTVSRSYGGFHNGKRKAYLASCRELLVSISEEDTPPDFEDRIDDGDSTPTCSRCEVAMELIHASQRPSWQVVFDRVSYDDSDFYSPFLFLSSRRVIQEYG